ncbi:MAG TPA: NAD-dependent malic enzyme [Actinomycetota bacterium]|nr:NAD-dependent malic enzyme [Actinomycetota bacterium]
MPERPYELISTPDGLTARIRARGNDVLRIPMLNRGTAFTQAERRALGLVGLLPSGVSSMEAQVRRTYGQYSSQPDALAKHLYLASLRDRNEVLFYRLLADHLQEMLPIVYTPTIGEVIERFSHEYNRPRGVFLSIDHPEDIEGSLAGYGLGSDDCDLIVATDSEGILGIGDQGVGGIQISLGTLTVYTGAGGIHPRRGIPVVLDVGTDNLRLLNDELYLGARHARVRDQRYDDFIDAYVTAATKLFPHALLHWEDFGAGNARRILDRYAGSCCTFNDDMQGTAAVVFAAILAAIRISGGSLRDQRVVILGAGTAGMGIADMVRDAMVEEGLSAEEATRRFWALDRKGLLTDDRTAGMRDFQVPYAHPAGDVAGWAGPDGAIRLAEVVANARPTVLIGTSTQPGAFSEPIVRRMAAAVERPIILPLSNPTSRCEALPEDLLRWTDGRALVATGSPFPPVDHDGQRHVIAQANNALVFPGLGLGVAVSRARRVSDAMIAAAAQAVAELSDVRGPGAALLPPVDDLRLVSAAVGIAVAKAAAAEGLAEVELSDPVQQVHEAMWRPEYPHVEAV